VARVRLSEAEIADLCAPAPIAYAAWLKSLEHYGRRADLQLESHCKYG
jgi:hypothetical protein